MTFQSTDYGRKWKRPLKYCEVAIVSPPCTHRYRQYRIAARERGETCFKEDSVRIGPIKLGSLLLGPSMGWEINLNFAGNRMQMIGKMQFLRGFNRML